MEYLYSIISKKAVALLNKATYSEVALLNKATYSDTPPLTPTCLGRGGDTSMAGMAIAIPGVLNISKTGDTMGKIR